MHGCLNARTTTSPTTSPVDRPTSPGAQTVRGGDHGAAVIICPYSVTAATSLFPERLQGQRDSALDEEEWEIVKIVGKRRTRSGYECNAVANSYSTLVALMEVPILLIVTPSSSITRGLSEICQEIPDVYQKRAVSAHLNCRQPH